MLDRISKEKAAAEERKKKSDFLAIYNDKMIIDQFSNVFDLCKGYECGNITTETKIVVIHLLFDDVFFQDKTSHILMTESSNNILSELMTTSERLAEKNIKTTYRPFTNMGVDGTKKGIVVKLYIPNPFYLHSSKSKNIARYR